MATPHSKISLDISTGQRKASCFFSVFVGLIILFCASPREGQLSLDQAKLAVPLSTFSKMKMDESPNGGKFWLRDTTVNSGGSQ